MPSEQKIIIIMLENDEKKEKKEAKISEGKRTTSTAAAAAAPKEKRKKKKYTAASQPAAFMNTEVIMKVLWPKTTALHAHFTFDDKPGISRWATPKLFCLKPSGFRLKFCVISYEIFMNAHLIFRI